MPFFDDPVTPATPGRPPYANEVVKRWTAQISAAHDLDRRLSVAGHAG
ncbi:MAG TPA: hypothetical protein VFO67_13630 [Gemmatimonadales bacterium]|nr:hypothetical protein [Gemmatimonadales bacterium]